MADPETVVETERIQLILNTDLDHLTMKDFIVGRLVGVITSQHQYSNNICRRLHLNVNVKDVNIKDVNEKGHLAVSPILYTVYFHEYVTNNNIQ